MNNRPNRQRDALVTFWTVLIPGDAEWPSAAEAIDEPAAVLDGLSPDDREWVRAHALSIADRAAGDREAAMTALEAAHPDAFGRVLAKLYEAYYTTPRVHARVEQLANAGPREASPHFDRALLDGVLARQSGLRRL